MTYTATYSPEDNKLRMYTSARLDPETYTRVRAVGFAYAPKQELFYAPSWTPQREDLLLELCGEIDDEDKSLVERAEERSDRFSDYSESRAEDASQAQKAVDAIAGEIPFGQPILIGHHSERHPDPTVDNWLKLDGDARDISLDARFYDQSAQDHPDNKINAAARIAKDVLDRTANERGTVVIFADRYATSDRAFNMFAEVKAKLISQGVPEHEVAIVHDYPKREDFEGLKQAMCAGRVRVTLSTTEKFGVGVNVQTRLKAEIHMDLPQRPDQVEQREGRIIRYGNSFDEVEIYRLISEPRDVHSPKAHDLQRAQLLERKQTFLTQFKTGSHLGRRLEDVAGDVRLSPQMFALAKAQATGNPLAMEKLKLEHEIKQVSLLDRSHNVTHHFNLQELNRAEASQTYLTAFLPTVVQAHETFLQHEHRDAEGKLLSLDIVFNGREFTQLKDAYEHLRANSKLTATTSLQVNTIDIPIDLSLKPQRQGDFYQDDRYVVNKYK